MNWIKKMYKKTCRAVDAFNDEEIPRFQEIKPNLSRDQLKRTARILFIDDEDVELMEATVSKGTNFVGLPVPWGPKSPV